MPHDYSEYFAQLVKRMNAAVKVPFRQVVLDGWKPKLNDCHTNADLWVEKHPDCKALRGWLFWPPDEAGRYTFMAHSVIERTGELFDITPIDENTARDALHFLPHLGTEEEFSQMKILFSSFLYPPVTWTEWRESQISTGIPEDMDTEI